MSKKLRGNLIKKKITKEKKENFIGKALGRKKFKSKKNEREDESIVQVRSI